MGGGNGGAEYLQNTYPTNGKLLECIKNSHINSKKKKKKNPIRKWTKVMKKSFCEEDIQIASKQ